MDSKIDFWQELPKASSWVNDFENIFTETEENFLDSIISDFEKRTSIEIAIITIPSYATEIEKFDDLTLHIAKSWGIGKPDKMNGILIGISKEYRKIRIQNADGIRAKITDLQTKIMLDENMIPHFKNEDYYKGSYLFLIELITYLEKVK